MGSRIRRFPQGNQPQVVPPTTLYLCWLSRIGKSTEKYSLIYLLIVFPRENPCYSYQSSERRSSRKVNTLDPPFGSPMHHRMHSSLLELFAIISYLETTLTKSDINACWMLVLWLLKFRNSELVTRQCLGTKAVGWVVVRSNVWYVLLHFSRYLTLTYSRSGTRPCGIC